ncbi:MAG: coiled-coil domain-containing protein [Promethearchaeia archaeon]
MSVHGNQNILPLFILKENLPPLNDNEELTLAFYLLIKDLNKDNKIISFSRLLWPFLSIQGIVSTHIILDGLQIFSKRDKLTNPPRQPLIGHILRNIDNRTQLELLERIIEVLSYKDKEAEEIGESEESEFQKLRIPGLVNPEFLAALMKLIPFLENKPINEYMPLDSSLTTELALNISEQYRNTIETMKGNALRWESQIELIGKEVEKWLTEIKVKIKDAEERFKSQINKTSSTIDPAQIEEKMKKERDIIDQWKVTEKKKVIENIATLFKTSERYLEDIIKKNRFFSRDEALKSKNFEELLPHFENHFEFLKSEAKKFIELVDNLMEKFEEFKEQARKIDNEAEKRLNDYENELKNKLKDRNEQLKIYLEEKEKTISALEELRDSIENLYNKITEIILKKKEDCLREKDDLIAWSIKDSDSEFFTKPIQWVYMPLYAMFIEDEDMMEEYMRVVLPGYISKNNVYEVISGAMKELGDIIDDKVEDDMKIRSNFEFSCENKNILEDPNFKKKIQKGISSLRTRGLINDEMEGKIREYLKLLP